MHSKVPVLIASQLRRLHDSLHNWREGHFFEGEGESEGENIEGDAASRFSTIRSTADPDGSGTEDTRKLRPCSRDELTLSCVGCMTWLMLDHKTNQRKFRRLRMLEEIKQILHQLRWNFNAHEFSDKNFSEQMKGLYILVKKKRLFHSKDNRRWRKLKKNKYKRHIHGAAWWRRYKLRPDKYVSTEGEGWK